MNIGQTVFSQLMQLIPTYQFQTCVDRYQGERYVKDFSCWDQFLCLAFAQLTYREGLRDIVACLRAQQPRLYHMGFRGHIARSTLAYANLHRDWRIFADFAQGLIATARDLYQHEPLGLDLAETVYAFDSTTVDLCLTLFPWARFRRHKSAVKIHTLLDLRGNIPTSVYVTGGQVHDVNLLDQLLPEAGRFICSIAPTWTFGVSTPSPKPALSLSPAPSRTRATVAARGAGSIAPLACVPIKPFASLDPRARAGIPLPCDAFTTSTPRRICA